MNLVKSAMAQGIINPVIGQSGTQPGETTAGNIISALVGMLLIIAFLLAFIHLILGGLRWITAGGDKNALESAQSQITQAIVGLIIVAATWAIMLLLGSFLGLGFPNFTLPTVTDPGTTTTPPTGVACTTGTCMPDIQTCYMAQGTPTGQTCTFSGGPQGTCCIY